MPEMINRQRCGHEHTDTHTQAHISSPLTNLDSVKPSLLSLMQTRPPDDSGGENERKSPERFRRLSKVKTSPARSTLQQFNTVFGSDVVI